MSYVLQPVTSALVLKMITVYHAVMAYYSNVLTSTIPAVLDVVQKEKSLMMHAAIVMTDKVSFLFIKAVSVCLFV